MKNQQSGHQWPIQSSYKCSGNYDGILPFSKEEDVFRREIKSEIPSQKVYFKDSIRFLYAQQSTDPFLNWLVVEFLFIF